jgi:hypothetical protein
MLDELIIKILRYPRRSAALAVVLLILAMSILWWNFIWQSPQRVFEGMLANNLTTSSVTKQAGASGNGRSVEQYVRLQMGNTNAAAWLVMAKQNGSSVTTESLGTPSAGYIRYTEIAQQKSKSRPLDLHNVLNVWGKGDGKTDTSLNQLFAESVLDVSTAPLPPIGNLSSERRQSILDYIRSQSVFAPSYKNVKHEKVNGREVYTYSVPVRLGAYVRMMQAFAHDLGIHSLDTIDPSQYATVQPITLTMSVDRASHQLVKVSYPGSGFVQSYTDWGLTTPITIPQQTISTSELQHRLQALSAAARV